MWRAFFVLALALGIMGQTAQQYCCSGVPATPSPAPPRQTLLLYAYSCANNVPCQGPTGADPGATSAQALYWGYETLATDNTTNGKVFANCPGRSVSSTCQAFIYDQMNLLPCGGGTYPIDRSYQAWLNASDENGYYHIYGDAISGSTRLTINTGQGYCDVTGTINEGKATAPGGYQAWAEQPLDATSLQCIYNAYATSSTSCGWTFTGPYVSIASGQGVSEDSLDFQSLIPANSARSTGMSRTISPARRERILVRRGRRRWPRILMRCAARSASRLLANMKAARRATARQQPRQPAAAQTIAIPARRTSRRGPLITERSSTRSARISPATTSKRSSMKTSLISIPAAIASASPLP